MDTVFIRGLKASTIVGIYAWERRLRQTVEFDIEMDCDISAAAASDSIDDALDYKAVAKAVVAHVEQSAFQLVETLAESVAGLVLERFGVARVRLRLNKRGALSDAVDVGVMIERSSDSA
jgi:7,8-dihydroneopterin aldolase/epimerase/oxygenase